MEDAGIVRNRAKIAGAILSARAYLDIAEKQSFSDFLWDFVDGEPIQNAWRERGEVPVETELSRRMSKALAEKGFKFCGPTIVYAFMQAVGMVNDHMVDCCRHAECAALRQGLEDDIGQSCAAPEEGPLEEGGRETRMKAAPAKASASAPARAWQRMLSGRRLDLLDPSPLDIEIEDIAHGLARTARWNGQTQGRHIFSVAQHTLLVEALLALQEPRRLRRAEARRAPS